MTSIFSAARRNGAQQLSAFSAMTMTFADNATMSLSTRRCIGEGSASTVCSVVTIGMFNREQQGQQMSAGLATKTAELVLQGNDVELSGVQFIGCTT